MILPGSKQQKASLGTCVEATPAWLSEWCKTVLLQDDGGITMFKSGPHDLSFARADTGRDEDGTTASLVKKVVNSIADLLGYEFAGTLHLQQHGRLQEENIPEGSESVAPCLDVALYCEVIRMVSLDGSAARIVVNVVHHALQVVLGLEDAVMITLLPQG